MTETCGRTIQEIAADLLRLYASDLSSRLENLRALIQEARNCGYHEMADDAEEILQYEMK